MNIIHLKNYEKTLNNKQVINCLQGLIEEGFLESDSKGIKAILWEECKVELPVYYIKSYMKKAI